MNDSEIYKRRAGERAAELVTDGMIVGLGTGSTAVFVVKALGERVRAGLRIRGVPTSEATRLLAEAEGIPMTTLAEVSHLDLAIDGADEIDANLNLTKGGGGALLREKAVASLTDRFIVIADPQKLVPQLGAFPLPVEIVAFAEPLVVRAIEKLGGRPTLRLKDGQPYLTDNGLRILDCRFDRIDDPPALARKLDSMIGVAEHGLFCGMTTVAIIGRRYGVELIPQR